MPSEPITREEMMAMFGSAMPIEAVKLVWDADGSKTIGQIRDELRAIAARKQAEHADLPARLRAQYNASNNPPSPELPEGAGCLLEAADEIERLRSSLTEIRDMGVFGVDDAYTMAFAARQALEQK